MEEKTYKYYHNGKGYNRKQDYWNNVAVSYLSEEGQGKVSSLGENAAQRLLERNTDETLEKQYKKLCIGFRNSIEKKLSPDLNKVVESMLVKGHIDLVIYSFVAGGAVIQHDSVRLTSADFNTEGSKVVSDLLLESVVLTEDAPVEVDTAINNNSVDDTVKEIISEDINAVD